MSADKEPYEKPELFTIELKLEEVLATGCKTAPAQARGNNASCGSFVFCNQVGS